MPGYGETLRTASDIPLARLRASFLSDALRRESGVATARGSNSNHSGRRRRSRVPKETATLVVTARNGRFTSTPVLRFAELAVISRRRCKWSNSIEAGVVRRRTTPRKRSLLRSGGREFFEREFSRSARASVKLALRQSIWCSSLTTRCSRTASRGTGECSH